MVDKHSFSAGPNQIRPGEYKIKNVKGGVSALDYLHIQDDKSLVIVSHSHRTENQKWLVAPLGEAGCSISNANTGLYLTLEDGIKKDAQLVASPHPATWLIVPSSTQDGTYKIKWPNTGFVCDLKWKETKPGTMVHLWYDYDDDLGNQRWKFDRCHDSTGVVRTRTSVTTITTKTTTTFNHDSDVDSDYTL